MSKKFYVDYFNEVLKPCLGWMKKYWKQYVVLCFLIYTVAAIIAWFYMSGESLKDIFTKIKSKFKKNEEVESE